MPVKFEGKITSIDEVKRKQEVENSKQRKFAIEPMKVTSIPSTGTYLIVDGKLKKISNKSRYLMDMITLDNE